MSDEPYLGEVLIISWNWAPKGWAFCNGQTLPINQNQALYSILGTKYGGDGVTTFALPNLQGRTPIHWTNRGATPPVGIGQAGGESAHTLTIAEMPSHNHTPAGSSANANSAGASGAVLAARASTYAQTTSNLTALNPGTIGNNAGGQPHDNMQPYLVFNFVIALQGIFPTRA